MKRFLFVLASAMLALFVTTTAQAATYPPTFDPSAAPTGTHLQTGTISCSTSGLVVNCTTYELAGVGNANATATLDATYMATVQCRNHGGQIVDVKSQAESAPTSTGKLQPKNGRLTVPALSSGPVPSDAAFEAQATCPNGNWTKEVLAGSTQLASFTYTLQFARFTGDYVTITG